MHVIAVHDHGEFEKAFSAAQGAGALLVVDDSVFTAQRTKIAKLALKNRLPTMYGHRDMVEAGGLMTYGPDYGDLYRHAAGYVHKILNGAKPSELPVEPPTKFEFILNLKTAKALGLTVSPSLLARADEVLDQLQSPCSHVAASAQVSRWRHCLFRAVAELSPGSSLSNAAS